MFLVRIAPKVMKGPVSFLIEFLAAIPSIAYGMWGLFILAPFLQRHLESWLGHGYAAVGRPRVFHWLFQETSLLPTGEKLVRDLPLSGRDMFSGGLVLAGFVFILVGVACGSLPGLGWGSVMLECPHCGQHTPSQLPECKHCRRSFREEVAGARSSAIPPKRER